LRDRNQQADRLLPQFNARERALAAALRGARLPFQFQLFSLFGRFIHWLVNLLAPGHFHTSSFEFFLRELRESPRPSVFDFIGLDYYDPFAGHMFRPPSFADLEFPTRSLHAWLMDGLTSKWWDWRILPEGLHFFAGRYAQEFQRPILIAENGMALRRKPDNSAFSNRGDEVRRSEFLEMHVREIIRLRRDGVPLIGYLHWSLTDNYEWGSFTPRFGLFSIDYAKGTERLVEDHLGDRPSETYSRLVREAKSEAEMVAASGNAGREAAGDRK
jgi:beta-glucosidase